MSHVFVHIRGPWYTCKVCGRRHESTDVILPYQRKLKICSYCSAWWAKESQNKINQIAAEKDWNEDTDSCGIEDWSGDFVCILPENHHGPHVAADVYGVALSVWTGDFDR